MHLHPEPRNIHVGNEWDSRDDINRGSLLILEGFCEYYAS